MYKQEHVEKPMRKKNMLAYGQKTGRIGFTGKEQCNPGEGHGKLGGGG